jgi:hypothetical protein
MKSIKEMSEEYLKEEEEEVVCVYDRYAGFVDGANYVLSVLFDASYKEDWISNPKEGIRRFFEIYKELKKK